MSIARYNNLVEEILGDGVYVPSEVVRDFVQKHLNDGSLHKDHREMINNYYVLAHEVNGYFRVRMVEVRKAFVESLDDGAREELRGAVNAKR